MDMWKMVYDKLKGEGLNPYPPGIHQGECTQNYCVVIDGTQMASVETNKLGQRMVEIIAFVPASNYIGLEAYSKEIKAALKEVSGLRNTGFETPPIPENEKKAFSKSIEYTVFKKLEG